MPREFGPPHKLVGKNYTTAGLHAKFTGRAKYAEDYRAEGMLFCKLLLSSLPHARVTHIDASRALAIPGVKAILTAHDVPPPADDITDNGTVIKANKTVVALDITKSMIFGSMKRESYLEHYDPHRWKIQTEPSGDAARDPHSS